MATVPQAYRRPPKLKSLAGQIRSIVADPFLIVSLLLLGTSLLVFVIYPLFQVLRLSLAPQGKLSLEVFQYIVGKIWLRKAFTNSLLLGSIVATTATIVGFIFAFTLNRVKIPGVRLFQQMAILPVISPPFMFTLSVILLLGRNGLITKQILGLQNFDIYGLPGLVLVQTISMFPIAYLVLNGVLRTIGGDLEDGAQNLGASKWAVVRTVTFPLAMPGLASSWLLIFVTSLADFANPIVISGKFDVLSVQTYLQITGQFNLPRGAGLAILLLLPALVAFFVERYWTSRRSYVTVTGKPSSAAAMEIPAIVRWILLAVLSGISAIILIFYGVVIAASFVKLWGINWTFTLEHFRYAWDVGYESIRATVILATWATMIGGLLSLFLAFLLVRKQFPGRGVLGFTSMVAYAVPGTVVGIGYILAFNSPPLLLTGTATIIVLCFIFREMPVGIEAGVASLKQIDPAIEEASTNLGAGTAYTFWHVTLPMLKPALVASFSYMFVRSMTAVSAVIFLVSARWNHLTALIYAQTEIMRLGPASVLSLFLIVIVLTAFGLTRLLVGSDKVGAGGGVLG